MINEWVLLLQETLFFCNDVYGFHTWWVQESLYFRDIAYPKQAYSVHAVWIKHGQDMRRICPKQGTGMDNVYCLTLPGFAMLQTIFSDA